MKTPLLTVLSIFIGLFIYTKFAGPIPFFINSVQTNKTNLFTATGIGKATAVPNTALLSLGVTKTAQTVQDAQNQTNTVANKLIANLKNLGVEEKDIKTTNYSVNPNYDFRSGRQITNGYTVTQNLEVKVKPIEKANNVIDTATKDGANIIGGLMFILDDQTQKDLENKARKEAVNNAKEKAQSLANIAGIKLGRIVDVQENFQPNPVKFRPLATDMTKLETETTITPGENTIEITITLSYETY